MTANEAADHSWVRENLLTYLAGGLHNDDRSRFEAHVGNCGPCLEDLNDAQAAERVLGKVFADAQPAPGMEDRVIQRLRAAPGPAFRWGPYVTRIAMPVAAVLMLGVIGYFLENYPQRAETLLGMAPSRAVPHPPAKPSQPAPASDAAHADAARGNREGLVRADRNGANLGWFESRRSRPVPSMERPPAMDEAANERDKAYDSYRDDRPAEPNYFRPMTEVPAAKESDPVGEPPPVAQRKRIEEKVEAAAKDLKKLQEDQRQQAPQRKIIRSGELEFEVENFDASLSQILKIAGEEQGYVGTVSSDRLPNGKVKGTIVVRVPPDRIDTLVLKLRALGELKSQRITSEDITKRYTDLESQLRAARAMEARLIEIIKTGQGKIKDILEAEKELGRWREKIELFEGEKRYFDNLVSLSTLTITLFEKDIRTPFGVTETEKIQMGLETEDVEKAYRDAISAVDAAKGRVTKSELKKLDAGQLHAVIACEVPPDAAGPLRDRLSQLGRVARLDVRRAQSAEGGSGRPQEVKVERKDTIFQISIYNLANIEPRETAMLRLACQDPETAYKSILARVEKAGGRVVSSSIIRQKAEHTTGNVAFEVPSKEADAVQADVRSLGEAVHFHLVENPDSANTTSAKKGFRVELLAIGLVPPRETITAQLAVRDVTAAYRSLHEEIEKTEGRVLTAWLNENDPQNVTATLEFEARRDAESQIFEKMAALGDIARRTASRSEAENAVDSKIKVQLSIVSAAALGPRETFTLAVEVTDVDAVIAQVISWIPKDGRKVESHLSRERNRVVGRLSMEVPLKEAPALAERIKATGILRVYEAAQNRQIPLGTLSLARINLTLSTESLLGGEAGLWEQIKGGLRSSFAAAGWSLKLIVIGLLFVLPWALIVWVAWKAVKRFRSRPA
ncbi:MAG: DUF4349 domain-containing protein [Planctomycetes bacterium]|nr:DUF4349 domain-containing protein [Planctomycetota bacterium]